MGSIPRAPGTRVLGSAACVLLVLGGARHVAAHGPAAAVTGVIVADARGPTLLRLTEGLAVRSADGLTFLCPASFGLMTPPLAIDEGASAWISGASAGYLRQSDGTISPRAASLASSRVIAFARGVALRYALTYDGASSDVLAIADGEARLLFTTREPWLSLASDGSTLWLARSVGNSAEIMHVDARGVELGRQVVEYLGVPRTVQLRSVGTRVFLHATLDAAAELHEVSATTSRLVTRSERAMSGPVRVGDTLWLGVGRELTPIPIPESASARVPVDADLTCLEEVGGDAYVCLQTEVHRVADVLIGQSTPLVRLAQLRGSPTSSGALSECDTQWLTFQADLLRAQVTPTEDAGAAPPNAGAVDAAADGPLDALPPADAPDAPPPALPVSSEERPSVARAAATDGCSSSPHGGGSFAALALAALTFSHTLRRRHSLKSSRGVGPS